MANGDGVYVLGAVRASHAGTESVLAGVQPRVVLAYLALSPGRPVPADEIAEALWPTGRREHWSGAVRGVVAKVRAFLAANGQYLSVESLGGSYRCDVGDPALLDLTNGQRLLAAARDAFEVGDHASAAVAAEHAAETFSGSLLPGVDGAWLDPRRAVLRERHKLALVTGATARTAMGCHERALDLATRAVELDHLDESCHRALIAAEAAGGRRAAALRAYGNCRRILAEQLGIPPDPATEEMYLALIAVDADPATGLPTVADRHFVGRKHQLETLQAAWNDARAGGRRLMVIHGESGVGKTRLALEAVRQIGPHQVLYGRSSPEQTVPYEPYAEAIRRHLAQLGDDEWRTIAGPVATRLRGVIPSIDRDVRETSDVVTQPDRASVFDAFLSVLDRIAVEPTVLILDDVHHADPATHLLSRFLMRRLADRHLLVIATYRDDVPPSAALADTITEFNRLGTHRTLPVAGLTVDEVGEMLETNDLDASDDVVAALHRRTGGNGFYLVQVIESAHESSGEVHAERVPDTVAELVRHRTSTLSRPAREVLCGASVLGVMMPGRQLEALISLGHGTIEALDELFDRRLLVEATDDRIGFPHGIVRSAVYGQLSRTRRRRFHVDAARAVASCADTPDWSAAAHHYAVANDPARASEMLTATERAAELAMSTHAYEQAALLYRRASSEADRFGFDEPTNIRLRVGLGAALRRSADLPGARAALQTAIDRARVAHLPIEFARGVLELTAGGGRGAAVELSDERRAALLQEAIDGLDDTQPDTLVTLLAELALALLLTSATERRAAVASRATALANGSADANLRARAAVAHRLLNMTPDRAAIRLAWTDDLVGSAREAVPTELLARLHMWRLTDCFELGDRVGVDRELTALRSTADELEQVYWYWIARAWTALHSFVGGDEARADREVDDALAVGGVLCHPEVALAYGVQLVGFRMRQGRGGEVVELLRAVFENDRPIPAVQCGLAACLAQSGEHAEARDHIAQLMRRGLTGIPFDSNWGISLAALAEAACELGDREIAGALLEHVEPYRDRFVVVSAFGGGGVCWGPYAGIAGSLKACLGRPDEATTDFDHSLELIDAFDAPGLTRYETAARDRRVGALDASH